MRRRIGKCRTELAQQYQTVALPVDNPEHNQSSCRFLQRTGKRRTIPRHPRLVARRRIDDDYRVSMRVAEIDQLDPAIGLIEIERRAFDLLMDGFHHIGIRRVGFHQHDIGIAPFQVIGQRQCDDAFADTTLAATNGINGIDCRIHRLPLQIVGIRFDRE